MEKQLSFLVILALCLLMIFGCGHNGSEDLDSIIFELPG